MSIIHQWIVDNYVHCSIQGNGASSDFLRRFIFSNSDVKSTFVEQQSIYLKTPCLTLKWNLLSFLIFSTPSIFTKMSLNIFFTREIYVHVKIDLKAFKTDRDKCLLLQQRMLSLFAISLLPFSNLCAMMSGLHSSVVT